MPTKTKGMTSIEIAILVAVVLVIAVAVGWYLYTTFGAAVASQANIRVVSAMAFSNGTIKITVMNGGGNAVVLNGVEVYDRIRPLREGWVWVGPGGTVTVHVDLGSWITPGIIIQGKVLTTEGYVAPFSVRVLY